MSIKDNIKEELLKMINHEKEKLEFRININNLTHTDTFDCQCEEKFLHELSKFVESI